jgi:hypothetical protein
MRKPVDQDVATIMDMVIGDYLAVLHNSKDVTHSSKDRAFVKSCNKGVIKICEKFNIDYKKLDVDRLL